jgi:citrate/tricarballylate utilization protein
VLLLTMLLRNHAVLFAVAPVVAGQSFYTVIPYVAMMVAASLTFLFSVLAVTIGLARFWREAGRRGASARFRLWLRVLHDAATLRYLAGDGHGCNDRDERFTTDRRRYHHLLAYGFLLCFASTSVATLYHHLLGWPAPYGFVSLPVLLGTAGGVGIIAGTAGLFWLKLAGDHEPQSSRLLAADVGLLLLLIMIAVTGLLLLALRATGAMGVTLAVHLGLVLAFFLTMPYGKFVHAPYRVAALARYASETSAISVSRPIAEPPFAETI